MSKWERRAGLDTATSLDLKHKNGRTPGSHPGAHPGDNPGINPGEHPGEKPDERPAGQTGANLAGEAAGNSPGQAGGQQAGQPGSGPGDRAPRRTRGRVAAMLNEIVQPNSDGEAKHKLTVDIPTVLHDRLDAYCHTPGRKVEKKRLVALAIEILLDEAGA